MPRKNRKGNRRNRSTKLYYEDYLGISQQAGTFSNITKAILTGLPPRMNFRIRFMEFCGTGGYVPGTTTVPGFFAPASCQFWFMEGANNSGSTSGVVELSSNPRRKRIYQKRSADWYSREAASDTVLAGFEAICPGQPAGTTTNMYVRGHIKFGIDLAPEVYPAACPSLLVELNQLNPSFNSSNYQTEGLCKESPHDSFVALP